MNNQSILVNNVFLNLNSLCPFWGDTPKSAGDRPANRSNALLSSDLPRSHPDALHGLEQLSLGLDRGGNDDFRLLKLFKGLGSDVTHTGDDGTY